MENMERKTMVEEMRASIVAALKQEKENKLNRYKILLFTFRDDKEILAFMKID